MKVYLDTCCYNRQFDDQTQAVVRLETQAIDLIQQRILKGEIDLVWSFMLEFENSENPYPFRRYFTELWQDAAAQYIGISDDIKQYVKSVLTPKGIKSKDAYHIACARAAQCDYLITTDKRLYTAEISDITIINPLMFVMNTETDNEN